MQVHIGISLWVWGWWCLRARLWGGRWCVISLGSLSAYLGLPFLRLGRLWPGLRGFVRVRLGSGSRTGAAFPAARCADARSPRSCCCRIVTGVAPLQQSAERVADQQHLRVRGVPADIRQCVKDIIHHGYLCVAGLQQGRTHAQQHLVHRPDCIETEDESFDVVIGMEDVSCFHQGCDG